MKLRISLMLLMILFAGCSTLTLEPAKFDWPLEAVVTPDDDGIIVVERYSIAVNIADLFLKETENPNSFKGSEVRFIRNVDGYYFITSKGFKSVYVFEADNGTLSQSGKILITENGLNNPAFNQRTPFIELIDGNESYNLSDNEIVKD